jgi:NADH-quinone oxidoreductase subunit N
MVQAFLQYLRQNPDIGLLVPEMQLAVFGMGILLTDFLLDSKSKAANGLMALAGIAFSGVSVYRLRGIEVAGFHNSILVDPFFIFFSTVFLSSAALVVLLSVRYLEVEHEHHGEYYALLLFATAGMMFLASGIDLIVLFLGLETMALSFYVLVGFLRRDKRSNEAALKYLLLGAFSSGILVYGFSILYGLAGSTNLVNIKEAVEHRPANDILVLLALATVSAGLFFKIAAAPFHQWAPDVYEGGPTPIVASVSVASSAASFALLLRIFLTAFWPARANWEMMLAVVAVASMTVGNFAALTQTNLKRLLAYSSIAHAGYILLGVVAANATGLQGIAFYIFAYAFMQTGAFALIIILRRQGLIGDEMEDLNGLFERSPAAALLLVLFMLSLAGIPPTAGFMGKYFIFLALIQSQHYLLAIFAALYVVPALYYYFRLVVHACIRQSSDPVRPAISIGQWMALATAAVIVLGAGLVPEPFVRLANYTLHSQFVPFLR